MAAISICIIGKNEEQNIEECLGRLSKLNAEIVFVDTGSTDQTKELAGKYTKNIFEFAWCDDFSKARNFSLEMATCDHVLIVDCDEYLEESDFDKVCTLIKQYPTAVGQITRHSLCFNGDGTQNLLTDRVERLFSKHLYHYEGSIHEQVVPIGLSDHTLTVYELPLTFFHVGYSGNPEAIARKADRDIRMLLKELEKHPDDTYLYYQLGEAYGLKGDYENAFQILDKGFYIDIDETLPYVKLMITSYGYSMIETGRYEQALGLEGVFETFGTYADFACMMGDLYLKLNKNQEALDMFAHALTLSDYSVEGANSFIPLHNIGCIYEAYEFYPEAIAAYEKAAALGHVHAAERLADLKMRLKQ